MRERGACAFCGRPARGQMQLVVHDRLRHAWPICDAHAACTEVQEVKIMLRCMDSLFECSSLVIPPIMD